MRLVMSLVGVFMAVLAIPASGQTGDQGWVSLFDGKSLDGWKAGANAGTFSVCEGAIVAHGPNSHLFYVGPVYYGDFKDFELKVDVRTEPQANGGVFFHTQYQEKGLVAKGFEVQVNNSDRTDPLKTGSLYKMQDVREAPVKDGEWFTMHVVVEGRHVTVDVAGRKLVDWTEPQPPQPPSDRLGRVLSSGTFALQGHDERSTVYYKNIYVKPLFPLADYHVHLKGGLTIDDLVAIFQPRAVKIGVAENCGVGNPVTNDEGLKKALQKLEGKPVYRAMQAEGREWVKMFSPEMIAKFDYVFTDSMTWTNDRGKRMRLWMPNEVEVADKQQFMEMLVDRTVGILNNEPIDIYVNPTFLPAVIASEYDTLWTDARMDKVIQAAVKNGVAIEINARYKLPSETFIKRAKAAGAKFSFGTNNASKDDLGDLAYSRLMAARCGLTKDDMFVPKPDGQKPVQKKGLPR
ncbi:MAG: DUF1080 domain-containing protein [Phycisphaerae bacterium]|nr:DUF1080 domain-containing protein [Phycisphaerae bacterium]